MLRKPASELLQFLSVYDPEIQELFLETRLLIQQETPDATETVWDATNTVATGPTYTHSHLQGFIFVNAYRDHVTLGFNWGVDLDDPENRLHGGGKQVRHLQLRTIQELNDPYLLFLIRQAHSKAFRPESSFEALTIVKVMKGPKKRPTLI